MAGDSYWQQQYKNARPASVVLWCGAHRRLVRAIAAVMIALTVGALVWAILDDGLLITAITNVVTFTIQGVLWGYWFPRQADEWAARQLQGPDSFG